MRLIDLSAELAHGMPRYPSPYLPEVEIIPAATHEREARSAQIVRFGTHVSTHIDAPFHALPDGITIERVPLETLCGPARVIRLSGFDRDRPIDVPDLLAAAPDGLGGVVRLILDTGWAERWWGGQAYFTGGTYLTRAASEWLAGWPDLRLLGMDFPNVDAPEETVMGTPAPNHRILLGREIILLENLLKLSEVPDDFMLVALPPRLVGGDGCPVRAVAMIG